MVRTPYSRPVILLVDDDEALREAEHLILDDHYEVVDAVDGESALSLIRQRHIDLVLLDLLLPGTDGFQLLEAIRTAPHRAPVIVVSGINTAWTATAAMRLGAVDYLTKPFEEEHFLTAVGAALAAPWAASARTKLPSRLPVLLSVGLDRGVEASLAVALATRCRVEGTSRFFQALARLQAAPPDLLLVEVSAEMLRLHADPLARIRAAFTSGAIVVIDATGALAAQRSLAGPEGCTVLKGPISVITLLREIDSQLPQPSPHPPLFSDLVSRVLQYLAEHYVTASVADLGKAMGMAPYHLSRLFARDTGIPLKSYLNLLRVEAAKLLLVETSDNIDVIALSVGLHDASHLSRIFLAHTGTRPGEYRKRRQMRPPRLDEAAEAPGGHHGAYFPPAPLRARSLGT